MQQTASRNPNSAVHLVAAGFALMLIAWFSRCNHLTDSLWIDELHTAWSTDCELFEVASRAASGNQAPLYFWLNRFVAPDGVSDPVRLRTLSFLMAWLTSLLLFVIIRKLSSKDLIAFAWATLYLIDRRVLVFSVEARPYATLQFVSLLHVWFFLLLLSPRSVAKQRLHAAGWIASGVVMCQLHYTSLLLIPCEWLAWLFFNGLRQQLGHFSTRLLSFKTFMVSTLILSVSCLVSSSHILEILAKRDMWAQFVSVKSIRYSLLSMPIIPVFATLAIATRLFLRMASDPAHDKWVQAFTRAIVITTITPFLIAWVATASNLVPIFMPRYLVSILPLVYLAGGIVLSRSDVQSVVCTIAAVIVLLVCNQLIWDWHGRGLEPHKTEHWAESIGLINETTPEANTIYLAAGLIEDHGLASNPELTLAGGHTLLEFCGFPLACQSVDELMGRQLVAVPSRVPALTGKQIASIKKCELMVLVIRGRTATRQWTKMLPKLLGDNWNVQLHEEQRDRLGSLNLLVARPAP